MKWPAFISAHEIIKFPGIMTLLASRAAGAEPIVITDLDSSRLAFAKSLVPGVITVQVPRDETSKETASRVRTAMGMVPRVAMECTGVESSVHTAIYVRADSDDFTT